ncbi:hypothetical protein [Mycobacterium sp. 94-17]|uniref:hypothetical protein n=1 Tax=Mycobacterium sp. 94-17 TaxID=2986147 RepID=UPI002D1E50BF|nr:hypothetical protein [Mycobacterium sp. 94-17]MEB4211752.1 hypothetical protein [Mycobacterium sp. 94-17]
MLDEHTRESLSNIVERSITGERLVEELNPGFGDTRLPNMYLGETPTTVLLETIFHDVHDRGSNVVYAQLLVENCWRTSWFQ